MGTESGVSMEETRGYLGAPFAVPSAVGNLIRKAIENRYYIDSKAEVGEDGEQGGSVDS